MKEEKERLGEGLVIVPLLGSKAKPVLLKQSVKLKCQICSILIKKFAKKCVDASSL